MMRVSLAFSALFLLCACPVATVEGDEGGGGLAPNIPPPDCDRDGFDVDFSTATAGVGRRGGKRYLRYDVRGEGDVYDRLEVVAYLRDDEETLPAGDEPIRLFADDGLANCETCVIAYRGCDGNTCAETYLADGDLLVSSSGGEGDRFAAKLVWDRGQSIFREVDGDGEVHERGYEFCGSNLTFEAPIGNDRKGSCSDTGNGSKVGSLLSDWALPNCYGDMVGLHDDCGRVKAKVLMLTTGWCPACRTRVPQMETEISAKVDEGAQVYYLLGEMGRGEPPSPAACMGYARGKGIDPARVLIDNAQIPNGRYISFYNTVYGRPFDQPDLDQNNADAVNAAFTQQVYTKLSTCPTMTDQDEDGEPDYSWGLPYTAVLDGENNRYVWGSGSAQVCPSPYRDHSNAVNELVAP